MFLFSSPLYLWGCSELNCMSSFSKCFLPNLSQQYSAHDTECLVNFKIHFYCCVSLYIWALLSIDPSKARENIGSSELELELFMYHLAWTSCKEVDSFNYSASFLVCLAIIFFLLSFTLIALLAACFVGIGVIFALLCFN